MKFRGTFIALLALLLRCWRGLRAEQVLAIAKPRLLCAVERFEALSPSGLVDHYRAGIFDPFSKYQNNPSTSGRSVNLSMLLPPIDVAHEIRTALLTG